MTALRWEPGPGTSAALRRADTGSPVASYAWGPEANHPHLHAVRPLDHAGVVTNHAPWDHRWHHGLWWSWKFVDDVLFWEDHAGYGGIRDRGLGRAVVVEHAAEETATGAVVVRERLHWVASDTEEVHLTEERTLSMTAQGLPAGVWAIDWDHTWHAPQGAVLSATPYPEVSWGGYGGLAFRAARAAADGETLLGDGGRRGVAELHGERLAWAAYGGRVDGAGTDEPDDPAHGGVVLVQHPENPGGTAPVFALSAEEHFGFLGIAPAMHVPVRIGAGEALRLRFRSAVVGDPLTHDLGDAVREHYVGTAEDER